MGVTDNQMTIYGADLEEYGRKVMKNVGFVTIMECLCPSSPIWH